MQNITTISELLETAGAQYRVFDLGRRVTKLSREHFKRIEQNEAPYPYPMQGHAWLAILFWTPKSEAEHNLWFLKFPLDEQGLLQLVARDDFLRSTLAQIGQPEQKASQWGFTPKQDKMAYLHSRARLEMKFPASTHLDASLSYLRGDSLNQWQTLGVQGLADLAVHQATYADLIASKLPELPEEVLTVFLPQLENEPLHSKIAASIGALITAFDDPLIIAACIRSLASSPNNPVVKTAIQTVLGSPKGIEIEVLVAISGRAWETLHDEEICLQFLECLARNSNGPDAFNHVLRDLLCIPETGKHVRNAFRNLDRSPELGNAIGDFLTHVF